MRLSQILDKSSIIAELEVSDKKGTIDALAQAAAGVTRASREEIAAVLLEREQLGSTGIGGGIAIPHGKLDQVDDITIGIALSRTGVSYDSLDDKPVHIFFLLLTPENSAGGHLRVLAQISKLLKAEDFKKQLLSSGSAEDIYETILERDEEF
mgnify:CR=1 FL=1